MTTDISSGVVSDVGNVRDHNEDSYLVRPPLFVIADGMGGHAAGEVASRLAVESLSKSGLDETSADGAIRQAISIANRTVYDTATGTRNGMGTTCVLLLIGNGTAHLANVGDSRIYLLREGELRQMTRDHTIVAEMLDQGLITSEDALRDAGSAITRAIGGDAAVDPDVVSLPVQDGDRFLLCSDGLTGMIEDERIRDVMLDGDSAQATAQRLVDAAKAAGGDDNVTVLVVDVAAQSGPLDSPASARRERSALRTRSSNLLLLLAAVLVVLAIALVAKKFT
jgi:protein phosphatase